MAISRTLATDPRLVLADEPTGNLDSHTGAVIRDLLQRLNRERSLTVLLVTHSSAAAAYAGRTVRLRDGSLVGERHGD